MSARLLTLTVAAAALTFAVPSVAFAASPQTAAATSARIVPLSGVTMLKLSANTAQVLTDNGVQIQLASEARTSSSGIEFPIVGGLLDSATLAGRINHVGGLTFVANSKKLTIRDFTIDTTSKRLTAYVDQVGARIAVLDLNLSKATISKTSTTLSVKNVLATLDRQAATALNSYFGTHLFTAGLFIGAARVSATTVTLNG